MGHRSLVSRPPLFRELKEAMTAFRLAEEGDAKRDAAVKLAGLADDAANKIRRTDLLLSEAYLLLTAGTASDGKAAHLGRWLMRLMAETDLAALERRRRLEEPAAGRRRDVRPRAIA